MLQFQARGYFFCISISGWDFECGKTFREAPMLSRARIEIVCCFSILFALAGPIHGAGGDASLFVSYEGPMPLPSVNPGTVSRQRLVNIQLESLPMDEGQPVVLNLFENTEVRAVCDGVEPNVSGGFVWNGHVEGVPGGASPSLLRRTRWPAQWRCHSSPITSAMSRTACMSSARSRRLPIAAHFRTVVSHHRRNRRSSGW